MGHGWPLPQEKKMRPVTVEIPADGETAPIPLDIYQVGPVQWAILEVDGVVDIDLEFTMDDIWAVGYDPATGEWFATSADSTGETTEGAGRLLDANDNLITPTAVRFTNAGVGTAVGRITQSGVMG